MELSVKNKFFELNKNKAFKSIELIDFSDRLKFLLEYFYRKFAIELYKELEREVIKSKRGTVYEYLSPILFEGSDGEYGIAYIINEMKRRSLIENEVRRRVIQLRSDLERKYRDEYNKLKGEDKEHSYSEHMNKFREEFKEEAIRVRKEVEDKYSDSKDKVLDEALKLEFGYGELKRRRIYLNVFNRVIRKDVFKKYAKEIGNIISDYYVRLKPDEVRIRRIDDTIRESFNEFCGKVLGV